MKNKKCKKNYVIILFTKFYDYSGDNKYYSILNHFYGNFCLFFVINYFTEMIIIILFEIHFKRIIPSI